ncbi:hypothetical protein Bbelb_144100 [Branchiostoma belcheri]|nr:hypothetical protein Bbelb_144100 [Branchiostoma belcheri]
MNSGPWLNVPSEGLRPYTVACMSGYCDEYYLDDGKYDLELPQHRRSRAPQAVCQMTGPLPSNRTSHHLMEEISQDLGRQSEHPRPADSYTYQQPGRGTYMHKFSFGDVRLRDRTHGQRVVTSSDCVPGNPALQSSQHVLSVTLAALTSLQRTLPFLVNDPMLHGLSDFPPQISMTTPLRSHGALPLVRDCFGYGWAGSRGGHSEQTLK